MFGWAMKWIHMVRTNSFRFEERNATHQTQTSINGHQLASVPYCAVVDDVGRLRCSVVRYCPHWDRTARCFATRGSARVAGSGAFCGSSRAAACWGSAFGAGGKHLPGGFGDE